MSESFTTMYPLSVVKVITVGRLRCVVTDKDETGFLALEWLSQVVFGSLLGNTRTVLLLLDKSRRFLLLWRKKKKGFCNFFQKYYSRTHNHQKPNLVTLGARTLHLLDSFWF